MGLACGKGVPPTVGASGSKSTRGARGPAPEKQSLLVAKGKWVRLEWKQREDGVDPSDLHLMACVRLL